MAGTTIKITPSGSTAQQTVKIYEFCRVTLSSTDRIGRFELVLPRTDTNIIDLFTFNSEVEIEQDGNTFGGIVLDPGKSLDRNIKAVTISGVDFTGKTQKILVTESYSAQTISDIVDDLFTNYATWATRANIETCAQTLTITFPDKFLFDCMDQLCEISGYQWYVDENKDVHFFQPTTRVNSASITDSGRNNFWTNTAVFKSDTSKIVNRLTVKGGKATSDLYSENITVTDTEPVALKYTPKATTADVTVTASGTASFTVGVENVTPAGTKDFLINFTEKHIKADQATTGTYTVSYKYEYPIKLVMEEPNSIADYGYWDDVLIVDTDEQTVAAELGQAYLEKNSQPVTVGTISPFANVYKPGELVLINISALSINEYLQVKEVVYESIKAEARVERTLQLESMPRDLTAALKDFNKRLNRLEKDVYATGEDPVVRYIARSETTEWTATASVTVNSCPIPSASLYPGSTVYPC